MENINLKKLQSFDRRRNINDLRNKFESLHMLIKGNIMMITETHIDEYLLICKVR